MQRDQLELVTAYVDGEATAEECARVEADAELLAEVERHRATRARLRDVDPPSAVARESAIAAALAVFDDEVASTFGPPAAAATPDVTAPTNIVPFERRRRMRWIQGVGAAAAVTAVVVAGAVIATRGSDDGGTADEARENTAITVVTDPSDQAEPDQDAAVPPPAAADVAATDSAVIMAAAPTSMAAPTQDAASAAESATADSVGEYEATVPAADASGGATAPLPPTAAAAPAPATTTAARMIVVVTEDDLRQFADTLKETPTDIDDAELACDDGSLKGDAVFEDDEGTHHPIVVVAIDATTIGAFVLDDCEIVLEAGT